MSNLVYPFDTTGLATTNLVQDEVHSLTEVNAATYRILIPTFAPFYLHNLSLDHVAPDGGIDPLIEGVDYYCSLPYMAASRSTGQAVYGGLSIITALPQGTMRMTYQTLGGDWCADADYVYQRLLETTYNRRTTWWDLITDVQNTFPPTEHPLPVGDIDGMTALLEKLEQIRAVLLNAPDSVPAMYLQHMLAKGNPHSTTLLDLGLENVQNYPAATDEEVAARLPLDKTVTLRQILTLLN